MREQFKILVNAVAAGISIGIGGWVFILCDSKIIGSALFSIGLFMVCSRKYNLYTGKIGYIVSDRSLFKSLFQIWIGDFIGAAAVGLLFRCTKAASVQTIDKVSKIASGKINDGWMSIFILGVFCGIIMYLAVDTFNTYSDKPLFQEIGILLGIMVFILCGFNHCIADMFYITAAGAWSVRALLYILVVTAGNSLGSVIIALIKRVSQGKKSGI